MNLIRTNPIGIVYKMSDIDVQVTRVELLDRRGNVVSSMDFNVPIEKMNSAWFLWINGQFVQDAFKFLTTSEREFIKTGITPTEWEEIFPKKRNKE